MVSDLQQILYRREPRKRKKTGQKETISEI